MSEKIMLPFESLFYNGEKYMALVTAMLKIIATLALGFFLFKRNILTKEANAVMSKIIILATCPCMVFSSIVSMGSENKKDVYILLIAGVIIYAVLFLVAFPIVKLMRVPKGSFNTYLCMMVFGNVGFLGFPLASSLLGDLGLFYIGILNFHFSLFIFTIGMTLMTGGAKKFEIKNLINPGTISVVLALVLFLCGVKVPSVIMAPLEFIGQLTSPMAMIVLGGTLASYSLKKMFGNWRYYIVSLFKLLIFPIAAYFICRAILGEGDMTSLITIYVACPTATIISMQTLAYGGDWENASAGTGLCTILSLVTIPALWLLMGAL